MRQAVRCGLLTLAGVLLLQTAWILVVAPFRGADEFDHAFRAAGVASGQWRLTEVAENGRGLVVEVPASLVRAASDQCEALLYTGPDNCTPIEDRGDGRVAIATSANNNHPVYYWVVGTAGRPFEGATSLYAMRLANALLCAVGVALAAGIACGARTGWGRIAFLAALTPTLVYSTVVAAPNGPEMIAGLCLWASLLRLVERPGRHGPALFAVVGASAAVLGMVRLLGPLWLGLIVVTVVVFAGPRTVRRRVAEHPRSALLAALVAAAGTVGGVGWTLLAGFNLNAPGASARGSASAWWETPSALEASRKISELGFWDAFQLPLWTLQTIGAFPLRDEPAPVAVYPLVLVVVVALLVAALRRGTGPTRAALVLACLTMLLLPVAITLPTMHSEGLSWQGRYGLPYGVGLLLMAGAVLDRRADSPRLRTLLLAALPLWLAHLFSVLGVRSRELAGPPSSVDPDWHHPSLVLVAAMVVAGCALQGLMVASSARGVSQQRSDPAGPGPQDERKQGHGVGA